MSENGNDIAAGGDVGLCHGSGDEGVRVMRQLGTLPPHGGADAPETAAATREATEPAAAST